MDDLIAALKAQLDEFEARRADMPDRIRVSAMVPRGMAVQVPYERDGSVNLDRRLDDGGPTEVCINGEDLDELLATMPPPESSLFERTTRIFGLPVVDEREHEGN